MDDFNLRPRVWRVLGDLQMDPDEVNFKDWQQRRGTVHPPPEAGTMVRQLEAYLQRHLNPEDSPFGAYGYGRIVGEIVDYAVGLYQGGRPFVSTQLLGALYIAINRAEAAHAKGNTTYNHPAYVDDEPWDNVTEQLSSPILCNIWTWLLRQDAWDTQKWPVYEFTQAFGNALLMIQQQAASGVTVAADLAE